MNEQNESSTDDDFDGRHNEVRRALGLYASRLGERTEWGVLLTLSEEERCVEVTIEIPRGLPKASRAQLEALRYQRIQHTDEDRAWDEAHGLAAGHYAYQSCFLETVGKALTAAHSSITKAAWAAAMGKKWTRTLSVAQRDDSKYAKYGDDLRSGIERSLEVQF